jgi:hypothetical protein
MTNPQLKVIKVAKPIHISPNTTPTLLPKKKKKKKKGEKKERKEEEVWSYYKSAAFLELLFSIHTPLDLSRI